MDCYVHRMEISTYTYSVYANQLRYIRHISTQKQLSTRVGCGQVHHIIENDLDKCRVVAPNLPTKTDDLSHSTGHGWTTREKVVNG
uniref:Uncharacterized protein n=2 Tax=Oryza sativa subsp. japonica TaxID=39947 RepID=Q2R843_ORYSJ|nr:hypothetical protein LOC_Os11g13950 [Oryza sativa Japonica Group]ABA92386.1 hypothetical protein LOC_Os11g13950 [Oryza sativa Japonica Group]